MIYNSEKYADVEYRAFNEAWSQREYGRWDEIEEHDRIRQAIVEAAWDELIEELIEIADELRVVRRELNHGYPYTGNSYTTEDCGLLSYWLRDRRRE